MPSETSDEARTPAIGTDVFRMLQELGLVPGPPHVVTGVDIRIRNDEFVTMQVEMVVSNEMMTALLPELTPDNITETRVDQGHPRSILIAPRQHGRSLLDDFMQETFENAILYGLDENGLPNRPPDENDSLLPIPGAYVETAETEDEDDEDVNIFYSRCEACDFEGQVGPWSRAARSANRHNSTNHPLSQTIPLERPEPTEAMEDDASANVHHGMSGWWADCNFCNYRTPIYRAEFPCVGAINDHLMADHEDAELIPVSDEDDEEGDDDEDAPVAPLPDGHIETRETEVRRRGASRPTTRRRFYGVCDICDFETTGSTYMDYAVRRINRHLSAQHPGAELVASDEGHGEEDDYDNDEDEG